MIENTKGAVAPQVVAEDEMGERELKLLAIAQRFRMADTGPDLKAARKELLEFASALVQAMGSVAQNLESQLRAVVKQRDDKDAAMRQMTLALNENEWADLLAPDAVVSGLEVAIGNVLEELRALQEGAPVQAQEPFAYMIADSDGKPHFDEFCVAGGEFELDAEVNGLNQFDVGRPYTIVPVYRAPVQPVDMVLFCPACGLQHIDAPNGEWTNPPHRSHLCHGCKHVWRPADVLTNGVASIKTAGTKDSAPVQPVAVPDDLLNFSDLTTYGILKGKPVPTMGAKFYKKSDVLRLITAPVQPVAVPDGWKLVPIEPDSAMTGAGHTHYRNSMEAHGDFTPHALYCAMIAATPAAQGDATRAEIDVLAECIAAPAVQGDAKELTDDEILSIAYKYFGVFIESHPAFNRFYGASIIRGMRAAIAAKAASK